MSGGTDGVGMAVARRLGVAVVVVVLTLTLVTGNVVVAGHQTVLDPDYVTETVAEEDGYEAIHAELIGDGALPIETLGPLDGSAAEILGEIAPPEYLQSQTETNLQNLYAYLHGNDRGLRLVVDTAPVKNRTGAVVADRVADLVAGDGDQVVRRRDRLAERGERARIRGVGVDDPADVVPPAVERRMHRRLAGGVEAARHLLAVEGDEGDTLRSHVAVGDPRRRDGDRLTVGTPVTHVPAGARGQFPFEQLASDVADRRPCRAVWQVVRHDAWSTEATVGETVDRPPS